MKSERSNHVTFRTNNRPDGTKGIEVHTPESVLPVYSKEELEAQLKHYARGLMSLTVSDSVGARRKYVEFIRPALRYYCKKYSVTPPNWLATDTYFTKTMSASERQKQFGLKPLRIGEFQKMKPAGVESVSYPGKVPTAEEKEAKSDGANKSKA